MDGREALIVGIDQYYGRDIPNLSGCVNDANNMIDQLKTNYDGTENCQCTPLLAGNDSITAPSLIEAVADLFSKDLELALFYFAGHGTVNNLGGYLVTQEAGNYYSGVPMLNILTLANDSKCREVFIILDCCHSGALGATPNIDNDRVLLRQGVSILTASRSTEPAAEINGSGLFTSLVCEALQGGAADIFGNVTVASVYASVDQALGVFEQRPLFKSHVSEFVAIKQCKPIANRDILKKLRKYFPEPHSEIDLDPSFEPDLEPRDAEKETIFGHLQKMRAVRIVEPVGEEDMFYAAKNRKSCRLTAIGRHYWRLAPQL